jgi:hypothetical protein
MNTPTSLRSPVGHTLFLCLTAALLAAAATSARPAPRSEMVVPGYQACAPRAASPAPDAGASSVQTPARKPVLDTAQAQAPVRCGVRAVS